MNCCCLKPQQQQEEAEALEQQPKIIQRILRAEAEVESDLGLGFSFGIRVNSKLAGEMCEYECE